MPRALGRAEKHYQEAKTRKNSEKPCIASINIEMHNNLQIWPINGLDLTGKSQLAKHRGGLKVGRKTPPNNDLR